MENKVTLNKSDTQILDDFNSSTTCIRENMVRLRVLGKPQEKKIINILLKRGNYLTVGEITKALKLTQPEVSNHLKELRKVGLIKSKRVSRHIFYSVKTVNLNKVLCAIKSL